MSRRASASERARAAAPQRRSTTEWTVGGRVHRLLGAVPTAILWGLVVLWTLPTAGVFVTSFRKADVVVPPGATGWWTELPDVLPDRIGRVLLVAVLLCLVAIGLLWAAQRLAWRHRLALGAIVAAVAGVWALLLGDLYPAPYVGTALVFLAVLVAVLIALRFLADIARRLTDALVEEIGGAGRLLVGLAFLVALAVPVLVPMALIGGWEPDFTLESYRAVFASDRSDDINMGQNFLNTLAITLPGTVIPIAIAAFAAYALAWMDFKGRHWWFIGMVAMLAVPLQMALIPLMQLYSGGAHLTVPGTEHALTFFPDLDLAGSRTAVWLAHIGFGLPLAVFLLHNYIASLPRDLFEAARMDGADHPTIFWKVVLPLSVPALAAFAILQFLWVWNDFLVARTYIGGEEALQPMTMRLSDLTGSRGQNWHLLTSAAFVSIVVPLIVFFALQRYFVRGLLAGSVKG